MTIETLKVQRVIEAIKTWTPPEQLELIQAITKQLQGLYTFKESNQPDQVESFIAFEHEDWLELSQSGLEGAYGEDEPEYSLDMLQEPNPVYEAR